MSRPETMTAVAIREPGGPEVLVPERRPVPVPGPGEILVRVRAAGVNRPDAMQRAGAYPAPPGASDLPGLEVAGEVAALGEGVDRWRVGDPVCALVPGGGYAEFARVHATHALPRPAGLTWVQAAALPETHFTVWHNVFQRGRLRAGEKLLVHGGSSGIGTTAILLGKAFGATVVVTAGTADKCEACRGLGADAAINYRDGDWTRAVTDATGGRGPDLILDMVGGPYVAQNHAVAATDGRIVSIAFQLGSKVEVDLARLLAKRLTHTGSTLRPRSVEAKAGIARELEAEVWPLLGAGRCLPVIHDVLPFREAARAHALLEGGAHVGKIVLAVD